MADQKEPSKHGRKNSLTKLTNLAHRFRHPHSSSSQPGTSSAAAQYEQDPGIHVEDDVIISSHSRTGDKSKDDVKYEVRAKYQPPSESEPVKPASRTQFVRMALIQRKIHRESQPAREAAWAEAAAARPNPPGSRPGLGALEPMGPLANEYCARFFPLECSEEEWNHILECYPDDRDELLALGRKA
ncbi:hypothetical protein E4U13_002221 [Claviceps humidiphila]|uniref:Uncharacterized protein n=1 Tax=Claviceps humidiphila TaxID=1294629 RepID=A0A9P7Q4H5_9HYPO|nr:hypothetical protein E4U13_002221 [Claviceps humidiphila]